MSIDKYHFVNGIVVYDIVEVAHHSVDGVLERFFGRMNEIDADQGIKPSLEEKFAKLVASKHAMKIITTLPK